MSSVPSEKITLQRLREIKSAGRRFAMLTAYDFPTAALAAAAGAHSLLIGDSMGSVLLGHESTRRVPLELMLILGEAVRRGAPGVFLIGDIPFVSLSAGPDGALLAARRFRDQAGCDAVKFEAGAGHERLVERLCAERFDVVVHLGLRPQSVLNPEDYRAQARDRESIRALSLEARRMADAGAAMILLEAVPPEASEAVVQAVSVPVVGCGAGPACDGHVVVTQDMLGLGQTRPPRFVPVHADTNRLWSEALRRYVQEIESGVYPGPGHVYAMRGNRAVTKT